MEQAVYNTQRRQSRQMILEDALRFGVSKIVKAGITRLTGEVSIFALCQGFLRCFRDPIWVPRISENGHRVPRIREIGSPQVHTGYLTFSFKKPCLCVYCHKGLNVVLESKSAPVSTSSEVYWNLVHAFRKQLVFVVMQWHFAWFPAEAKFQSLESRLTKASCKKISFDLPAFFYTINCQTWHSYPTKPTAIVYKIPNQTQPKEGKILLRKACA